MHTNKTLHSIPLIGARDVLWTLITQNPFINAEEEPLESKRLNLILSLPYNHWYSLRLVIYSSHHRYHCHYHCYYHDTSAEYTKVSDKHAYVQNEGDKAPEGNTNRNGWRGRTKGKGWRREGLREEWSEESTWDDSHDTTATCHNKVSIFPMANTKL